MKIEEQAVNALRILSADQIQKANSGHPGLPLGCAGIIYTIFKNMNTNFKNTDFINRDRFILSAGHGSALLYSILHMYQNKDLTLEALKNFRQLNSKTPGHPEYKHTSGVEISTGPLGAGLANSVGFAISEEFLRKTFNKKNFPLIDHYTYALCGDGCMMEGISYEAMSLAGTLKLSKLILFYDSNDITIEGNTNTSFTENVGERFKSFGFNVLKVNDGNNLQELQNAIDIAKQDTEKPKLIIVKTKIGFMGGEKEGKASAHGEPLGEENIKALRKNANWSSNEPFFIPEEIYKHYEDLHIEKIKLENEWNTLKENYFKEFPEMLDTWNDYFTDKPIEAFNKKLNNYFEEAEIFKSKSIKNNEKEATRKSSGKILNILKNDFKNLIGGSADLGPSNKTTLENEEFFSSSNRTGRNIHFGVRELAMAGILNGLIVHGGIRAFVGTFFVFSDYMKPMIRLASLMGIPAIYVLTHDSIGVGEDGPTHEPIEQLTMLRSIPNINVIRPADYTETLSAYAVAVNSKNTPTAIVLSRQGLEQLANSSKEAMKGGYIIKKEKDSKIDLIMIATGSEVKLAIDAASKIEKSENKSIRVVSMPSTNIFDNQSLEYKEKILPKSVRKRLFIEAASNVSIMKYVGLDGDTISINTFGKSAPGNILFKEFGFTIENITNKALNIINN